MKLVSSPFASASALRVPVLGVHSTEARIPFCFMKVARFRCCLWWSEQYECCFGASCRRPGSTASKPRTPLASSVEMLKAGFEFLSNT